MAPASPDIRSDVHLVVDAACDVPSVERIGAIWHVVADSVAAGELTISDSGDGSRELTSLARKGTLSFAAHDSATYAQQYAEAVASGAQLVLSVHPSADWSDAITAAREAHAASPPFVAAQVEVIESNAVGVGVGLLCVRLAQLASEGASSDQLRAYAQRQARGVHSMVVPDHFDPVRHRITVAGMLAGRQHLAGTADGPIEQRGRLRTRRTTQTAVERFFLSHAPADRTIRMAYGHADAAGAVDPLVDALERLRPNASVDLIGRVGPRITQRMGERSVAVAWLVE